MCVCRCASAWGMRRDHHDDKEPLGLAWKAQNPAWLPSKVLLSSPSCSCCSAVPQNPDLMVPKATSQVQKRSRNPHKAFPGSFTRGELCSNSKIPPRGLSPLTLGFRVTLGPPGVTLDRSLSLGAEVARGAEGSSGVGSCGGDSHGLAQPLQLSVAVREGFGLVFQLLSVPWNRIKESGT